MEAPWLYYLSVLAGLGLLFVSLLFLTRDQRQVLFGADVYFQPPQSMTIHKATRPSDRQDKPLFTPGPLTTSRTVKEAMLRDLGSRDHQFIQLVRSIRQRLVMLGGATPGEYEAVIIQGSGTFGIEAVLSTITPPEGKWLIAVNGAYGKRMVQIARVLGIQTTVLDYPEHRRVEAADIAQILVNDAAITHVGVVHCETSTGIVSNVEAIGAVVSAAGRCFFVDAMSSFGAMPLNLAQAQIDFLVSSANKCIEGVPGFAFVLARRSALLAVEGYARSVSLDLLAQWKGLEQNGQFRFTPPTHTLLAFGQALDELEMEGGIAGRMARYQRNHSVLLEGMERMGFRTYLPRPDQSHIITSFHYPDHPRFDFDDFYTSLSEKGYVIYPGKVSDADCFRIGTIGRIFEDDIHGLLIAIAATMTEMGMQ
jgi:2-aminoethylphosphonate-pyruvate transaminase